MNQTSIEKLAVRLWNEAKWRAVFEAEEKWRGEKRVRMSLSQPSNVSYTGPSEEQIFEIYKALVKKKYESTASELINVAPFKQN